MSGWDSIDCFAGRENIYTTGKTEGGYEENPSPSTCPQVSTRGHGWAETREEGVRVSSHTFALLR